MSGAMDALWDELKLEPYREIFFELKERLLKKHDEKGVSYREMKLCELLDILDEERKELECEFWGRNHPAIINEALDIAICGIIIADWARVEWDRLCKKYAEMKEAEG